MLVALRRGEKGDKYHLHAAAHIAFIEGLIKQNQILLGGAFAPRMGDADAGYVLRTSSINEARAVADADPFVRNGVCRADAVQWQLVGINPDAIDEAAIVRPRDIS